MSNIFHSYVHGTGSNQPSIDSGTHPVDWPIYFEARRHSQTYQTPWKYVKWYWWWPSCQGCQMHLKVSRAQAWCPQVGTQLTSGEHGPQPRISFDMMHIKIIWRILELQVFVKIVRMLSLLAAFDFSFDSLCLMFCPSWSSWEWRSGCCCWSYHCCSL